MQAAFENVQSSLEAGLITPEQAEAALRDVELAAFAVAEEAGQIDMNDAIRQVRDEYNVSWADAKKLIEGAKKQIDAIPAITEKRLEIFVEYTGAGRPGGFQHGGSFIVGGPPGPDRSVLPPVPVTKGERVTITPAGAQASGGGGGIQVGPNYFSTEIEGEALIENLKTQMRQM